MHEQNGDVIVVGAGLIGLAIAFELAQRGASVRVYERGEPARAASWAGAGMLAPYTERITNEALLGLCASSLEQYPAFAERVARCKRDRRASAARRRALRRLRSGRPRVRCAGMAQRLATRGVDCEMLDRAALLAAEPWLGAGVLGGLLKRAEGYVDNRRLGRALVAACEARGRAHRAQRSRSRCNATDGASWACEPIEVSSARAPS